MSWDQGGFFSLSHCHSIWSAKPVWTQVSPISLCRHTSLAEILRNKQCALGNSLCSTLQNFASNKRHLYIRFLLNLLWTFKVRFTPFVIEKTRNIESNVPNSSDSGLSAENTPSVSALRERLSDNYKEISCAFPFICRRRPRPDSLIKTELFHVYCRQARHDNRMTLFCPLFTTPVDAL